MKRRNTRSLERLDERVLLAGDLIAQWRADSLAAVDGDVVSAWTDSVGSVDATSVSGPAFNENSAGGRAGLTFDASDGGDGLEVATGVNPLRNAEDFSVAVYFTTDSNALEGGNAEWYRNTGLVDGNQLGFGNDWGVSINAAGQVSTGMTGGIGTEAVSVYSTESGLNDGAGHTAVMTRSGATLSLYIDGVLSSQSTTADPSPRTGSGFSIGTLASPGGDFTGDISEVRIFNGQLDAAEVSTLTSELDAYYGNSAPVAEDDEYTVAEDTAFFFVPGSQGLLANDFDADGDTLTAEIVTQASHGEVSLSADGSFLYDSEDNFNGTDTFTYRVSDFRPGDTATVTITVTPVRDVPTPVDDVYKVTPGQPFTLFSIVGILANDVNPDRANMSAVLDTDVPNGSLTLNADGGFTYDPQDFVGRTSFTYRIDDGLGQGLSSPGTVNLAITTPPVAADDNVSTPEDVALLLSGPGGILDNDVDAENDPLTIGIVDIPTNGVIEANPDGTFNYVPNANFNGTDSFTYYIDDGFDRSQTVTATVNVTPVNDSPTATVDGYVMLPNSSLAVEENQGLLSNDFDLEGGQMTAALVTAPTNGTLELNADGSFSYTPNANFEGIDEFTYRASDGEAATDPVTVTIGVSTQPFVISEVQSVNVDTIETRLRETPEDRFRGIRDTPDWIEIQNLLSIPVDMGGMHLTDNADNDDKWEFPAGTVIEPGGYLLVFASGNDITNPELDENGALHTNFGLSGAGEYLAITATDGTVLFAYDTVPAMLADMAYGQGENGAGFRLTPTPGVANEGDSRIGFATTPTIDNDRGFFSEPFTVTITNNDPQTVVRYTLDGTPPTADNGITYTGPITISETSVLRASSVLDGYFASEPDTRTYVFLDDVVNQSLDGEAPEGWPERWGSNTTDYGMDPDIVNDPTWGPQMEAALTAIPSMSIVTDLDNLFDSTTGIYARPGNDGAQWERPASLELINPDGSVGFQHDIGLRIRGGFSRSTNNPKHAFRVLFDTDHSTDGWLNFPLFGDEGAEQFAKVDLRTAQNYSWAFQGDTRNSFLRDIYSRDLQRAMGNESTRGEYYHLYVNGQYFGLFQTEERPDARFAASYYGGDPDDYDVVHNDPRTNGATDGTTDAYERLWAFFAQDDGLSDANMEDYYRAQGMNPDGTRNSEYERLLDVDNLIDYMMITYYTSDADGPGSKFTRPGLNNYFTIFNREDPDGFKFVEHDSEHSLNTGNAAGNSAYNMVVPFVNNGARFPNFNPHYMHEQLAQFNSDYLIRFQDRVAELFADGGLMDEETVKSMLADRASEIETAIIAESARWGDAKRSRPFTKNDWDSAVRAIDTWIDARAGRQGRRVEVLGQFSDVDWWNENTHQPTLSMQGGRVDAGTQVIVNREGTGQLLYTLDGSDPRSSGGAANPNAIMIDANQPITINEGLTLRVRTLRGDEWSPITEAQFFVEPLADLTNFQISEIHYNPSDPTDAEAELGFDNNDDFEFLEFINLSDSTIDLTGAKLVQVSVEGDLQGVEFDFTEGAITKLAGGERLLVVEDVAAFTARYGDQIAVAGQWSGALSNGGETIALEVADGSQLVIAYDDAWHPSTDGEGPSLERIDPANPDLAAASLAASWQPSSVSGGSPGTGETGRIPGDSNGDGRFDESDLVVVFTAGEYQDDLVGNSTFETGDWNGDGEFDSTDLVFVFAAGTYRQGLAALPVTQLQTGF